MIRFLASRVLFYPFYVFLLQTRDIRQAYSEYTQRFKETWVILVRKDDFSRAPLRLLMKRKGITETIFLHQSKSIFN